MQMAAHTSCEDEVHVLPEFGGTKVAEELVLVQELTHRFKNEATKSFAMNRVALRRSHERKNPKEQK